MPDPVNEPQSGSGAEPVDPSGTPAGDPGSSGANGGGRTVENVYGELNRKHQKLSDQIAELSKGMKQLVDRFGAPAQPGQPQPGPQPFAPQPAAPSVPVSPYGAPRSLAGYTDEQLQSGMNSATLNSYQKEVISQELRDRRDERRVEQMFQEREKREFVNSLKERSEKAANGAFPALRDSNSEFSRRVEAELKQQRSLVGEFPTDRFDVANRIARDMGIESSRAVIPGFVAHAGGDGPGPNSHDAPEPTISDDEIARLARRLEHAMPSDVKADGRVVRRKFDTKRIKERSQQYADAADAFRSKGIKVKDR